ncbi:hypothetical protein MTR_2g437680 [Medicago truncatula]|uniref:Uncharacterized protein n=1 Tax=Medicago truncatula TaxID=3880 RepID=A0A072V693_MEDTR|nr:hypothetical protein MTR_2g437680 [Medicago truncatula]
MEVNGLGFDPSMTTFGASLIAKKCRSKTRWDEKLMSLRNGVEKDHSKDTGSAISSDESLRKKIMYTSMLKRIISISCHG